tara:strand:+ start:246 stop:497 length:252 start_codon:yes stop_codon:yes gene_type:complete
MVKPIGKVVNGTSNFICGTVEFLEDIVDLVQDEVQEIGEDRRHDHIVDRRERAKSLIGGKATKSELYYVNTPRRFRKLQQLSA